MKRLKLKGLTKDYLHKVIHDGPYPHDYTRSRHVRDIISSLADEMKSIVGMPNEDTERLENIMQEMVEFIIDYETRLGIAALFRRINYCNCCLNANKCQTKDNSTGINKYKACLTEMLNAVNESLEDEEGHMTDIEIAGKAITDEMEEQCTL